MNVLLGCTVVVCKAGNEGVTEKAKFDPVVAVSDDEGGTNMVSFGGNVKKIAEDTGDVVVK